MYIDVITTAHTGQRTEANTINTISKPS